MKKVLVATGTSNNKLNFAVDTIKTYLDGKGLENEVIGASIYEVDINTVQPDVIVAIGPHSFDDTIPIVEGIAFITKMGMDECCAAIYDKLTD